MLWYNSVWLMKIIINYIPKGVKHFWMRGITVGIYLINTDDNVLKWMMMIIISPL